MLNRLRSHSWIRLDSVIAGRDNNINLLRMMAATMVVFGHSFDMLWRLPEEPLQHLLGRSSPYTAVNAFFVLSGFLISRSWIRRSSRTNFFWLRFIRIYPALWCCIAFCLVIGAAFTSLNPGRFFTDHATWRFVGLNAVMLYKNAETLPGVFSSLRWPGIINGPLWTLPYELKLYISVAIAGTLGLLARPRIVLSGVVILAIGHTLIQTSFPAMQAGLLAAWMRLLFYYYAGVACFLYRDRILLNGLVALVGLAFVVVLAALRSSAAGAVFDLILPYLLLVLAFVPRGGVRLYNRLGDYSYGMYIFAFPIQQVLLQIKVGLTPYSFFFSAFSVTLVVAVASWHFVEKPALLMRDRIHTRADLWANLKGAFASRARVASPPSADVRAGGKSGCLEGDERPQKFPKI